MHLETLLLDQPHVNASSKSRNLECYPIPKMWKLKHRAEGWLSSFKSTELPSEVQVSRIPDSSNNFWSPTPHLESRHQGCLYLASPSPPGYRQAPPQTTNHRSTASRPPSGFGWIPPKSLGVGPVSRLGWGVGEKAGPGGNSRPRLPQPRAPAGTLPPPPRGRRQQCYHGNAAGSVCGRRAEGPRVGRGRGPRGGGARRERPTRDSLLLRNILPHLNKWISHYCSPRMSLTSTDSTYNSLISTIFLEPLTAAAATTTAATAAATASYSACATPPPSRPSCLGACASTPFRRVSAREGLAPPQSRAPP